MGMAHIRAVPDESITLAVDISTVWEQKMAAIRCHATQITSSPILNAPLERQRAFLGTEQFIQAEARGDDPTFMEHLRRR
jgi:LmbE family N-acetylglucosaminyl deacetylase